MKTNPKCDHYWLVRRGGVCEHCGDHFPGQFQKSAYELAEKAPAEPMYQGKAKNGPITPRVKS